MSKEDFTNMSDEKLIELKGVRMEHYKWLAHFRGDDGDSEWYYFENISPIDDELERRGIKL